MPDERFRIIFEGQERNLDQVLKKLEKAFDQLSDANPFEKINLSMAAMTSRGFNLKALATATPKATRATAP